MIGIYRIVNPLNEVYIGQSLDIDLRIYNHQRRSSNRLLRESIEKYGWINHKIEILCECEPEELNSKEEYFIKDHLIGDFRIFNSSLNATNAGRKKKSNEAYTVRCHPKVIIDVRKYAKEKSVVYDREKSVEKD